MGSKLGGLSQLVKAPEIAGRLEMGLNTLYILARQGQIPHYRIGGSIRFDPDEVEDWLRKQRGGPPVESPARAVG